MLDQPGNALVENRTFEELTLGHTARRDVDLFATVTGDVNPATNGDRAGRCLMGTRSGRILESM